MCERRLSIIALYLLTCFYYSCINKDVLPGSTVKYCTDRLSARTSHSQYKFTGSECCNNADFCNAQLNPPLKSRPWETDQEIPERGERFIRPIGTRTSIL